MKTQDYLDKILDDNEKAALAQFVGSEVMYEAVKKVLLAGIYSNGTLKKGEAGDPLRNFTLGFAFNHADLSNEQIGADLRASVSGINTLEVAFNQLLKYKIEPEKVTNKSNQAR